MERTFVDLAHSRPCHHCGADVLNVNPGLFVDAPMGLDPHPIFDGSTVAYGWRIEDTRWVVHLGSVTPDRTAFRVHECADSQRKGHVRMTDTNTDPFAGGDKRPSVSFKNAPIGTVVTCVVTGAPKLVQSRDYDTDKPAFWDDGNPKMSAVIDVTVDGEERSVWAAKPSSLFSAIAEAQKTAGQQVAPGGTLQICLTGTEPNKDAKKEPRKIYAAKYAPPDAFAAPATTPEATPPAAAAVAPPWNTSTSSDEPPF